MYILKKMKFCITNRIDAVVHVQNLTLDCLDDCLKDIIC